MKAIPLTKGKHAIVDDDDYDYLCQWKWHITSAGYAARRNPRCEYYPSGRIILMHRCLIPITDDFCIDHINGNPLDNRKINLRKAEHWQNGHNRPVQLNNTSGHKGICWSHREQKWKGHINVKGHRIHLGTYNQLTDAVAGITFWRTQLCGEFVRV